MRLTQDQKNDLLEWTQARYGSVLRMAQSLADELEELKDCWAPVIPTQVQTTSGNIIIGAKCYIKLKSFPERLMVIVYMDENRLVVLEESRKFCMYVNNFNWEKAEWMLDVKN